MSHVILNARFKSRPVTGVERFAWEVTDRLPHHPGLTLSEISPKTPSQGLKGHLWEQFAAPGKVPNNAVLFSPCNTGPVTVRRQLAVIHDAAVWDYPEGFSASFRRLYQLVLPRLARRCHTVATVSAFSRGRLADRLGIAEEKILVLGNAVGDSFSPGDIPSSEDAPGPVFLCVGSLDPRKNLTRLIKAWLDLRSRDHLPSGAHLHIAGGANPRSFAGFDRIEDASIRWLGRIDDAELIRQYRSADAFIFPSLYEGFGLPPVEAMACGCPVLLSDRASLPEVGGTAYEPADPNSTGAALYFDPESEAEIAGAITRFLQCDSPQKARIRSNAIARAAQFSWDKIASATSGALCAIA